MFTLTAGDDKAEEESDYSSEEEKKGDLPNEESSSEGEPFKDYLDAEFKDVEEAISQAVSELDDLFIKLNWSAPRVTSFSYSIQKDMIIGRRWMGSSIQSPKSSRSSLSFESFLSDKSRPE